MWAMMDPTHHGMYDLSMFNPLPNITVLAPSTGAQLRGMMHYYAKNAKGPVAIRYPKGIIDGPEINRLELPQNLSQPTVEQVIAGESIAILSVGNMRYTCIEAIGLLNKKSIFPSLYDVKIVKPLETEFLKQICQKYSKVITIEDGSLSGGYGEAVQAFIQSCDYKIKVHSLGFPVEIVEHASTREIFEKYGLDANGVFKMVLNTLI
jgi:1-deoxy-D-xylulose-5-phosphate synthase